MPLRIRKRWLVGLCLAAMLGVTARPVRDILVSVFEDPFWDHGTAAFSFFGERPEVIWIVALRVGDKVDDGLEPAGRSYTIPGPSERGMMSRSKMTTREGRHQAEIRYRIEDSTKVEVFQFGVDVLAQNLCSVVVRFAEEGPRASACTNHRPGTYGGTWPH